MRIILPSSRSNKKVIVTIKWLFKPLYKIIPILFNRFGCVIFYQYIPFLLEKATFYKKAKKSIFNISLFYKAIGMDNVDLIMRRYIYSRFNVEKCSTL